MPLDRAKFKARARRAGELLRTGTFPPWAVQLLEVIARELVARLLG